MSNSKIKTFCVRSVMCAVLLSSGACLSNYISPAKILAGKLYTAET